MSAVNMSLITRALASMLSANMPGVIVERNAQRNDDAGIAASTRAWIGVYRGSAEYRPLTIGAGVRPWQYNADVIVEAQAVSMYDGADLEDELQAIEAEIIRVIESDRTLGGTVSMVTGYRVEYQRRESKERETWHEAAVITVSVEGRA